MVGDHKYNYAVFENVKNTWFLVTIILYAGINVCSLDTVTSLYDRAGIRLWVGLETPMRFVSLRIPKTDSKTDLQRKTIVSSKRTKFAGTLVSTPGNRSHTTAAPIGKFFDTIWLGSRGLIKNTYLNEGTVKLFYLGHRNDGASPCYPDIVYSFRSAFFSKYHDHHHKTIFPSLLYFCI